MTCILRALTAALCLAWSSFAFGQSAVLQGGPTAPGHLPQYYSQPNSQPVIMDGGGAAGGAIGANPSELGVTARGPFGTSPPYAGNGNGPLGTNVCDYDAPTTNATGYHYLCFSANAQGSALIATGGGGTAAPQPLCFVVNGAPICLGGSSGTNIATYTPPTTVGIIPCWSTTLGLLGDCSLAAATLLGNPSADGAKAAPFALASLPARGSPDPNNDKILILNASTGQFNYATPGQIASSTPIGVASLGGATGAITLGGNLQMSGQQLQVLPGGTSGQILWNNGGAGAGFTPSGDIAINTSTGVTAINANAVTNAKLAQMAANSVKCNPTNALANAKDCVRSYITPEQFGAVCDGSTDDSAALQATINAATNGTQIFVDKNCLFNSPLTFVGKASYISVLGNSQMGTGVQSSALTYGGGAVTRAIDLRDTVGIKFNGVNLQWSNASFSGILLDYGSQTPGTNVSFYASVQNAGIQPAGSGNTNGATCINVSEAIEFYIGFNSFNRCSTAIHGQNVLGQSTTGLIEHNQFFQTGSLPIHECGESWLLLHNTFEQLASGKAGAFQNSTSLPCKGMVSTGNWYGDVTTPGGAWFNNLTADGFKAVGDKMSANNSGSNLGYYVTGGSGYSWVGGNYDGMSIPFQCDATTMPTGMNWTGNITTNITGGGFPVVTPSANCLNASEASNTPAVFGQTWTPTFTPTGGSTPATINNASFARHGLTTEYWFTATFGGTVTGTGSLKVGGLPFAAAHDCVFFGNDQNSSQSLSGTISATSTNFNVFLASNPATFPVATGSILSMHGSCETN